MEDGVKYVRDRDRDCDCGCPVICCMLYALAQCKRGTELPLPLPLPALRRQAPRWPSQGVGGEPQGSLPDLAPLGPISHLRKKIGSKTRSRLCSTSKHITSCDWSQVLQRSPRVTDHGRCSWMWPTECRLVASSFGGLREDQMADENPILRGGNICRWPPGAGASRWKGFSFWCRRIAGWCRSTDNWMSSFRAGGISPRTGRVCC